MILLLLAYGCWKSKQPKIVKKSTNTAIEENVDSPADVESFEEYSNSASSIISSCSGNSSSINNGSDSSINSSSDSEADNESEYYTKETAELELARLTSELTTITSKIANTNQKNDLWSDEEGSNQQEWETSHHSDIDITLDTENVKTLSKENTVLDLLVQDVRKRKLTNFVQNDIPKVRKIDIDNYMGESNDSEADTTNEKNDKNNRDKVDNSNKSENGKSPKFSMDILIRQDLKLKPLKQKKLKDSGSSNDKIGLDKMEPLIGEMSYFYNGDSDQNYVRGTSPGPSQTRDAWQKPSQAGDTWPGPNQTRDVWQKPSQARDTWPRPSQALNTCPRPNQGQDTFPGPRQARNTCPGSGQVRETWPRPSQAQLNDGKLFGKGQSRRTKLHQHNNMARNWNHMDQDDGRRLFHRQFRENWGYDEKFGEHAGYQQQFCANYNYNREQFVANGGGNSQVNEIVNRRNTLPEETQHNQIWRGNCW